MKYFQYIFKCQTPGAEDAQREAVAAWCQEHGVSCEAEIKGDPEDATRTAGLLEPLSPGDTLVASELAVLGKSLNKILDLLQYAMDHGITVHAVAEDLSICRPDEPILETLRQAVSLQHRITALHTIDALKAAAGKGRKGGRPHRQMPLKSLKLSAHHSTIRKMLAAGESKSQIARTLGCDRATLDTYLERSGLKSTPKT